MTTPKTAAEQRHYYRINDVVGLTYAVLEDGEEHSANDADSLGIPLEDLFAQMDREFNQVTNTLGHENPSIAKALGLLNRKVSMIAAHCLPEASDNPFTDSYEDLLVNISGCGMAFHSAQPFPEQTRLLLSIQLKPSNICLRITGNIISCENIQTENGDGYWVRVCFDDGNHNAQEQLIQHIVQKQCVQLDKRR